MPAFGGRASAPRHQNRVSNFLDEGDDVARRPAPEAFEDPRSDARGTTASFGMKRAETDQVRCRACKRTYCPMKLAMSIRRREFRQERPGRIQNATDFPRREFFGSPTLFRRAWHETHLRPGSSLSSSYPQRRRDCRSSGDAAFAPVAAAGPGVPRVSVREIPASPTRSARSQGDTRIRRVGALRSPLLWRRKRCGVQRRLVRAALLLHDVGPRALQPTPARRFSGFVTSIALPICWRCATSPRASPRSRSTPVTCSD